MDLSLMSNDKSEVECPFCNQGIGISFDQDEVGREPEIFLCRCPKCKRKLEIIIRVSYDVRSGE